MRHVMVTGTRKGATFAQLEVFTCLLRKVADRGPFVLHHGDCIGVDNQAHDIARELRASSIVAHCPATDEARAFCDVDIYHDAAENVPGQHYNITRNRQMVDCVQEVFAMPAQTREQFRGSGTWATIRYARGRRVLTIIWPDGSVSHE